MKEFVFGSPSLRMRFMAGERIIEYGVFIYIDVADSSVVHAALPLGKDTKERIQENVDEAIIQVQGLVEQNPDLEPYLAKRRLVVHMIHDYSDDQNEIGKPVIVDWQER